MTKPRPINRSAARRGVVMLAVLVIVTLGALASTTVLVSVQGQRGRHASLLDRDQTRALAWSGVQAVMAELAEQRLSLLQGESPELTESFVLFTDGIGRRGVVRLALLDEQGSVAVAEPSKLDVNHAPAEMLERLPGMNEALVEAIVAARPFNSVGELVRVEGLSPALLYGEVDELRTLEDAQQDDGASATGGSGIDASSFETSDARLIDLLTVFSFDPNLIAGYQNLSEYAGERRINLDTPWNDALEQGLTRIFGGQVTQFVRALMQSGVSFESDADVVEQLRGSTDEDDVWNFVLDSMSTSDDAYRLGRIDALRAPEPILTAVLDVEPEVAQNIISLRERLDEQSRLTPAWLVTEDVLTPSEFQAAADWLTTRSLQWRVRIEAGIADADQTAGDLGELRLRGVVVYDVVIDVASQRPRVALLRDSTMLDLARRLIESDANDEGDQALEDAFDLVIGLEVAEDPLALSDDGSGGSFGRDARSLRSDRGISRSEPARSTADEPEPGGGSGEQQFVDRRIGRWTPGSSSRANSNQNASNQPNGRTP